MKKLNRKWLTLEHYQPVFEEKVDGMTVEVMKPKTMWRLPSYMLRKLAHVSHRINRTATSSQWATDNPDYGLWDAQTAILYIPKQHKAIVYVCALLCRPFSIEADAWYAEHMSLQPLDRLLLMWDSRQYDRENGYRTVYGIGGDPSEWLDKVYHAQSADFDIDDPTGSLAPIYPNEGITIKMRNGKDTIDVQMVGDKNDAKVLANSELAKDVAEAFTNLSQKYPDVVNEMQLYQHPTIWEEDDNPESATSRTREVFAISSDTDIN